MSDSPRPLRLFHFDIKTFGNYGDTLLFEAVRQLFNGFGGGKYFEVYDSRPLREPVGPALVEYINSEVDAVVVGGGGLFLSDTNPNKRSGWQWNISIPQLQRLEKPLIVFAVGNNRFFGQPDFADPFTEHLNLTVEKSVFFGLRNTGSVETIKTYIGAANRDRVELQPCPTTLSSRLFPDFFRPEAPEPKHLGVQMMLGKRQIRAGFDVDGIYRSVVEVLRRLQGEGWSLDGVPHARADEGFQQLAAAELGMGSVPLWGNQDGMYAGVETFAGLPAVLGTRGHAQMVPFGMGAAPVSLLAHPKTGYFADDIGHPELTVDPRRDDFEERLYQTLSQVAESGADLRQDLLGVQDDIYAATMGNLAQIYQRLTGQAITAEHRAYTPFERELSNRHYVESFKRARADEQVRDLRDELKAARRLAESTPSTVTATPAAAAGNGAGSPVTTIERIGRRAVRAAKSVGQRVEGRDRTR